MKKTTKGLILCSFIFSLFIVSLAFTPHYTCGCGGFNESSQLTYLINSVSKSTFGKPLIPVKESSVK